MTRGELVDPPEALFSFKTAARFWSRNYKVEVPQLNHKMKPIKNSNDVNEGKKKTEI